MGCRATKTVPISAWAVADRRSMALGPVAGCGSGRRLNRPPGRDLELMAGQVAGGPAACGFRTAYRVDMMGVGRPVSRPRRTTDPARDSISMRRPCDRSMRSEDEGAGGNRV